MERQPLSIRKFAEVCGVSHTEIGRKMTALEISGTPQGKGLPTLLSPVEQDKIAAVLFIPAEPPAPPAQHIEVLGSGLSVYTPPPLTTRGVNSELSRHLQQRQLTQALGTFKGNQVSFRNALLGVGARKRLNFELTLTANGWAVMLRLFANCSQTVSSAQIK